MYLRVINRGVAGAPALAVRDAYSETLDEQDPEEENEPDPQEMKLYPSQPPPLLNIFSVTKFPNPPQTTPPLLVTNVTQCA